MCCCGGAQKPTDEPFWKDVVPLFQQLSQKELQMFPGNNWEHGWKYTTLVCDSQLYMRYLNQQFHKVGQLLPIPGFLLSLYADFL